MLNASFFVSLRADGTSRAGDGAWSVVFRVYLCAWWVEKSHLSEYYMFNSSQLSLNISQTNNQSDMVACKGVQSAVVL